MPGRLLAQRHFGPIHPIHARIAPRGLVRHLHLHPRNKAQLHQPMGKDFRKLQPIEDGGFAEAQSGESLQASSIGDGNPECQSPRL